MSVSPTREDGPVNAVAGLMAAAALFVSMVALAYRPLRLAPFAIVIALVAAGMGGRHQRLTSIALAAGGLCFAAGMVIAVITENPIY